MRKNITLLLLIIFSKMSFSQQTDPTPALTKQDYLQKSKNQKTIAFVLVGTGTIAWLAGASKYMNQDDNKDGGGEAAMIIGGTAALAGIPLFIISAKNKKKAMSISFKTQQLPQLQTTKVISRSIPSLNLKTGL